MGRWLKILAALVVLGLGGAYAAVTIGGPDLIYPRVPGVSYGPSSLAFVDTDPGKTIGGTVTLGRAQDETGVDMYMVHWGLEVGGHGVEDDAGHGDHGGSCKGFRDTNHVVMARPSDAGEMLTMEIPQGTVVPDGAVYLVAHTLYAGRHNLAKCIQIPIVNRVD
ncbi:MAG: hypothetical protein K8S25_01680 [Alphaproteobacteria bacterium]|nr:hypothetical protein [Alphaproteobacteria bacterium]